LGELRDLEKSIYSCHSVVWTRAGDEAKEFVGDDDFELPVVGLLELSIMGFLGR